MAYLMRASLLVAFVAVPASCGGGGSSLPPPPPPAGPNGPPTFTSPAAVSTRENAIGVVYRPMAIDPENATLTYGASIRGPDAARLVMNPITREIRFAAQPDFEAPADVGGNNVYDISLTVSDGVNTTTQNVAITVSNVANGFRVRRVATGLDGPVYAAGLPDGSGRVLVVLRAGRIVALNPSTATISPTDFLNITTQVNSNEGEKGLLTIAFSPNFVSDRTFYLHMNPLSANTSEIRRYRTGTNFDVADASTADPIISVAQPSDSGFTNHKGGMLAFDETNKLLIGLGDGGGTGDPLNNAQNRNVLLGKLLRIDVFTDAFPADAARDYSIPSGNPFASGGGAPEVVAMGLRNPFRGSVDPVTHDIFIGDVGQNAVEEIDRIAVNATGLLNFGWNRREGNQSYNGGADDPSFLPPVAQYLHGTGPLEGDSITGGLVYRGPIEDLQGQYIFGDYVSGNIWTVPIASLVSGSTLPASGFTNRNTAFAPSLGTLASIVAFGTDDDGNVYMVNIRGEVFILEPDS